MNRRGLRVAIVLKTNQGGLWILPQVEALVAQGCAVHVILPDGPGRLRAALDAAADHQPGVTTVPVPIDFAFRSPMGVLHNLRVLRGVLCRLRPAVALYHLYASALLTRFATIGTGIGTVHMVAGPLYLENPAIRAVERLLVRRDDALIAGSQHTAHRYAALGCDADRLSVVPYGVDVERFRPQHQVPVVLTSEAPFVVAMVAYFYAPKHLVHRGVGIKGHEVMLAAWRIFASRHRSARLVLAGAGFGARGDAYRDRLRADMDASGVASSVSWLGALEDVRGVYRDAHVSVSPSLSDNHGAVLEASAMGVPSIVSSAGALAEAVTPESGWVFPSGDVEALVHALEAAHAEHVAGVLARRGTRARAHVVEFFDARECGRRVADVVRRVGEGAS